MLEVVWLEVGYNILLQVEQWNPQMVHNSSLPYNATMKRIDVEAICSWSFMMVVLLLINFKSVHYLQYSPNLIYNMNKVIHLEVGWSLIVIHASNDDKTWFSTLADDALWSKVLAGS